MTKTTDLLKGICLFVGGAAASALYAEANSDDARNERLKKEISSNTDKLHRIETSIKSKGGDLDDLRRKYSEVHAKFEIEKDALDPELAPKLRKEIEELKDSNEVLESKYKSLLSDFSDVQKQNEVYESLANYGSRDYGFNECITIKTWAGDIRKVNVRDIDYVNDWSKTLYLKNGDSYSLSNSEQVRKLVDALNRRRG